MSSEHTYPPEPLYTVEQAARRLTISRSRTYELIASGALSSLTIGRLRRVTEGAIRDFIREAHDA